MLLLIFKLSKRSGVNEMGRLIIFKESMFFALGNKVCSFNGINNIEHMVAVSKEVAQRFCKIANANKDIIK